MKEIMNLFLLLSAFGVASAQSTREMEDAKEVILGPKKTSGGSGTSDKEVVLGDDRRVYDGNGTTYPRRTSGTSRESQINQVNREYDAKIYSIRNNRYLSRAEKERAIRQLEADRARRIRQINERYYGSDDRRNDDRRYDDRRRYEDDDNRYNYGKNKKYKKNNGKHLGWKKGKGNPHRYRKD